MSSLLHIYLPLSIPGGRGLKGKKKGMDGLSLYIPVAYHVRERNEREEKRLLKEEEVVTAYLYQSHVRGD